MDFFEEFLIPVMALLLSLFAFMVFGMMVITGWEDGRSEDRCLQYGEASGYEVEASKGMCFIEDPDYGWITYEERRSQRLAERGLSK